MLAFAVLESGVALRGTYTGSLKEERVFLAPEFLFFPGQHLHDSRFSNPHVYVDKHSLSRVEEMISFAKLFHLLSYGSRVFQLGKSPYFANLVPRAAG